MKRHPCLYLSTLSWLVALTLWVGGSSTVVRAAQGAETAGRAEKGTRYQTAARRETASEREENDSAAVCSKVPHGKPSQTAAREQGQPGVGTDEGRDQTERMMILPPNPDGPTLVDIGLYIHQIPEISEVQNHFVINAFMDLTWCDPRLAYDASDGEYRQIYLEEDAIEKLAKMWWPDVTFPNQVGPREAENHELIIRPDGTVEYEEKLTVRLEAHFDLHQFPFDRQKLEIEIEAFAWPQHILQLHRETQKIGFGNQFELPEWHTVEFTTEVRSVKEIRDRDTFSEFVMTIEVKRQYGYYLWKMLLPLVLLVMISWVVFWMTEIEVHDRMNISFIGLLTVVAYQFVATEKLPAISYFTLMDGIISTSFAVMILSVFENLVVHVMITQDRKSRAERLDRICRWLFPLTYIVALVMLSMVYLAFR